jgi:hypothetical protein
LEWCICLSNKWITCLSCYSHSALFTSEWNLFGSIWHFELKAFVIKFLNIVINIKNSNRIKKYDFIYVCYVWDYTSAPLDWQNSPKWDELVPNIWTPIYFTLSAIVFQPSWSLLDGTFMLEKETCSVILFLPCAILILGVGVLPKRNLQLRS